MNVPLLTIILILYLAVTIYLGVRGYRKTKTASDYLVAGRRIHPVLLALSYGATFISTSALVGFGGFAAWWGLSLFWIVFLNIFVGIFIAFAFYGKRTRRFGYVLQAHTFPELLGKRFKSKFLQVFGGFFIFLFMPLYAAAVLLGASRLLESLLNIDFRIAILIYTIIVAAYVFVGGIKGVIYTDALQGAIMIFGMLFLIIYTIYICGGLVPGLQTLNSPELKGQIVKVFGKLGHQGWTSLPKTGSIFWWVIFSSLTLGVGIGVLVQPQLVVRFMMVKSRRELYRSLILGSIFILLMTGGAYFTGTLSNVYFFKTFGKPAILLKEINGNVDKIIPFYITQAMPEWFSYIFLLTILSAAMSTLSSQFHAIGTAVGRDIYEKGLAQISNTDKKDENTIMFTRAGIIITLFFTALLAYYLPGSIIARATAVFFGLCTATFLPSYTAMLFWKKTTKAGVIASSLTGFISMIILFLFVYGKTTKAFGIAKLIFGPNYKISLPWSVIDPLVFALPLSTIVLIVVSLITKDTVPEITKYLFEEKK